MQILMHVKKPSCLAFKRNLSTWFMSSKPYWTFSYVWDHLTHSKLTAFFCHMTTCTFAIRHLLSLQCNFKSRIFDYQIRNMKLFIKIMLNFVLKI